MDAGRSRRVAHAPERLSNLSPYLVVLALPGSFVMLPALAWWLDRRAKSHSRRANRRSARRNRAQGGREVAAVDDKWFESQYNARAAVPEFPEIFARTEAASRRARIDCRVSRRRYGEASRRRSMCFRAPVPAAVSSASSMAAIGAHATRPISHWLARAYCPGGFTVVVPNYALCPTVTVEHIIRQMLRPTRGSTEMSTAMEATRATLDRQRSFRRRAACSHDGSLRLAALSAGSAGGSREGSGCGQRYP